MTTNAKQEALRRTVIDLIELEETLERTLGDRAVEVEQTPEVREAVRRYAGLAGKHRAALEAYRATFTDSEGSRADPVSDTAAVTRRQGEPGICATLTEAHGLLNEADNLGVPPVRTTGARVGAETPA
jgi:hypothetical protein